ncbi:MAG: TetR/AcrR family transcriptional regulator [Anaerolineae bacterium]
MDRRIQKTRLGLQNALLELLREKPLEQIEIQEITDRANSARVTFYRHYSTKEELLIDTIEKVYKEFEGSYVVRPVEHILDFQQPPPMQPLFELLATDRLLYKKLFTGTVSALIQQRLRHYIVQQVTLTFGGSPRYANLPLFLIANHIASALIGNIMWWLADDLPYSAVYMAQITHWMSIIGALTLVGRGGDITQPPVDGWRTSEGY